jgi:hypothetical protein
VILKGFPIKKRRASFIINGKFYNAAGMFEDELYCPTFKNVQERVHCQSLTIKPEGAHPGP